MRIYFGRKPEAKEVFLIDNYFNFFFEENNYHYQKSVDKLITMMFNGGCPSIAYTSNPLIINFFDDEFAKNHMWIIDEEGNHINMGQDESMLFKLTWGGPGETLADDARSFI